MQRKDKQINDIIAIEDILSRATVCRLGLCDGGRPYVVPLCFGYKENALYFHCAMEGKKLEILRKNENVCFEVDIDHETIKADQACEWGMKYKSVIGSILSMAQLSAALRQNGNSGSVAMDSREMFRSYVPD